MKVTLKRSDGHTYHQILNKNSATIGRAKRCDVVFNDEALSRQHCLVEYIDGVFYVKDLNSANGVYLDGERIPSHLRLSLTGHKLLSLGVIDCFLEQTPPPAEVRTPTRLIELESQPLELDSVTRKKIKQKTKYRKIAPEEEKNHEHSAEKNILLFLGIGIAIILAAIYL